ncbi:MAG: TonB-dependent receptor [Ignavibacteria bacterium]|nr:TonB-dependent receptor [Ignavibacteria bacterium]
MTARLIQLYIGLSSPLIVVAVFLFSTTEYYAQGKISGIVYDGSGYFPLKATVWLLSEDKLIDSTICGLSGKFSFTNLSGGIYKIEVSSPGYVKFLRDSIKLNEDTELTLNDTIYIFKAYSTDEITVEENKGLIQFSGEKKIFNVSESMVSKAGTVLDVLKTVPLVEVDNNDNILLRGNRNVKIFINDKPAKNLNLRQIPSETVERIELITNPSAKYEAEGISGIVNIVLRKTDKSGFRGTASLSGGFRERAYGGLSLNLKKRKFSLFSSAYSGIFNHKFDYSSQIIYNSPVSKYINSGSAKGDNRYFWAQTGAEHEVFPSAFAGAELSFSLGDWKTLYESSGKHYDSLDLIMNSSILQNNKKGIGRMFNSSVYFSFKPEDKNLEFQAEICYSYSRNIFDSDFLQNSNYFSETRRDTTNNKSDNGFFQIDYSHTLGEIKLESGYKGSFTSNDNNFRSDTLENASGNFTDDGSTNRFKLKEIINAGYIMFSAPVLFLSTKAGLRIEHSSAKGNIKDSDFTRSYFNFFPTLSLALKIGNIHQIQFSYSKRITRPAAWRLNPFVNKSDRRIYNKGNPELLPEITDSYELNYSLYLPFINFSPMFFFRRTKDVITNYSYLSDSNITVATYINASGMKTYGCDLFLSSKALNWLNLISTLSIYNTKFDTNPSGSDYKAEEGTSWKANLRAMLKAAELFNLELVYNYTGKRINSQGITLPASSFDISLSKSFMNNNFSVSLKATDIFRTFSWKQDVSSVGFSQSSRNNSDSRTVVLNISYNFGNTDEFISKKKKIKLNPNESRDIQENPDR